MTNFVSIWKKMIILVDQVTVREVASLRGSPQISKQLQTLPVATSQCQHIETSQNIQKQRQNIQKQNIQKQRQRHHRTYTNRKITKAKLFPFCPALFPINDCCSQNWEWNCENKQMQIKWDWKKSEKLSHNVAVQIKIWILH